MAREQSSASQKLKLLVQLEEAETNDVYLLTLCSAATVVGASIERELKRTAYELDSQRSERQLQQFLLLRVVGEQQRNNTRNHANDNELLRGKSCRERSYRQ